MSPAKSNEGFILIDALLAAALLALGGTMALSICMSVLDRQRIELDRSVALVNMQSLVKQFLLVAPRNRDRLENADELFTYAFSSDLPVEGTTLLVQWKIVATPRAGGEAVELAFLGPAGAT
jgi:hypothetical protein